jgi:KDO2-lipid IV(A) lauroyltransferase
MLSALLRLAAMLPLPVLHAFGALLGWTMYLLSAGYRGQLRANLAQAGYSEARAKRAAIASAGKMIVELPAIWLRPRAEVLAWIRRIEGRELVEAALESKQGVVFLTPHIGCFEITAQLAAEHFPITVLYREPKLGFLEPLIDQGRRRHNVRLAPADLSGVRELLAALKRGEAVGILPDQVPGEGEGVWAEFFGRPAYTMTLAMKLVARPNTISFMAFGERLPRGQGFVIHIRPLPEALAGESAERRMNRAVEELVRGNPGQYLWGYNRYKTPRGAAPVS